ncbi:hypothetical protein NUW58_g2425 [Xylaria curta]|uniref:Uncharacterized protein n=2 Tax=Xylaria curta TaxID=42375 RepID=A0ACC1PD20_9PEZI|nr:hypothetical protein NUW58_g2974 [Xylaria curta]KAJ2991694.1 hypothetical protein NUW58_g2425 [Xylaria curta]
MATEDSKEKVLKLLVDAARDQHRELFERALRNVLSSGVAELTYAQIADGLPLKSVVCNSRYGPFHVDHPMMTMHTELCSGVVERFRSIRSAFNITSLKFDSTLIHAYQNAPTNSPAFHTRLIEMIAVAVHQIAAQIFKSETGCHQDDGTTTWQCPPGSAYAEAHKSIPPTLFIFHYYCYYEQYPDGVADGVGYWAESQILGGVVLFDRREPGSPPNLSNDLEVDPNAIYMHSDVYGRTYRIYQLTDSQREQLIEFLLSKPTLPAAHAIPIRPGSKNIWRVDPEEAVVNTGVYRDIWERNPLEWDDEDPRDTRVFCEGEGADWENGYELSRKRARYRYMRGIAESRERDPDESLIRFPSRK